MPGVVRTRRNAPAPSKLPAQPKPRALSKSPASSNPPASSKPPAPVDRRRDLLAAAYALIAERGLEGLRTRDIAARAGINISTLHYYFQTKEALIIAVVEHATALFTARPPNPTPAAPTLRAHLDSAWQTFQTTPHLHTVLQELALRGHRDDPTRAVFRAVHDGWSHVVQELLQRGVAAGVLRPDLDPQAGARVVTSFIIGAMAQLDVNPNAFVFADLAREIERWAGGG